jgi:hypothetical protein
MCPPEVHEHPHSPPWLQQAVYWGLDGDAHKRLITCPKHQTGEQQQQHKNAKSTLQHTPITNMDIW